ncbi:MAG TPA: putative metallopeptidase [Candidatus Limnocylindrales bacterium]|nr:putative metallopeptidase [Candidatus Limnocylindrales bacterium]
MTNAAETFAELDAQYVPSQAIEKVARALINRHDRFRPLDELRIVYLERLGEPAGEGEGMLAKCMKATGPWPDVAHVDLVIWIWSDVWKRLSPTQREALTAHELCHPFITEKGTLKLLKHDLEEFSWVARHYGPWLADVAIFERQLREFQDEHAGSNVVDMKRPRHKAPRVEM